MSFNPTVLVKVTADSLPFHGNTRDVQLANSMEWSNRNFDDAGNAIDALYKLGMDIGSNTKTLIVYNRSTTSDMAIKAFTTAQLVDGLGRFPAINSTTFYTVIPAGSAMTFDTGTAGDRLLQMWIYVQSLGPDVISASFTQVQTSGSLSTMK